MTTCCDNQPHESTAASWADVIKASESGHAASTAAEAAPWDQAETTPQPGDLLMHSKFGACTVHRISEGVIHMAKETGRVIKIRLDMLPIRPLGVESTGKNKIRRVFTTTTEQL